MSDGVESSERTYYLDDLDTDYEGLVIPECPHCEEPNRWLLKSGPTGRCGYCGERFEFDVEVTVRDC